MGGDSDLVLLGMAIPVHMTPNIFVILPSGSAISYIVSLKHVLNSIGYQLEPSSTSDLMKRQQMLRVRFDLILLFIMNGNDYLPKLRGSTGLDAMFQTYLFVFKQFHADNASFLYTDSTLDLNIPFCLAYFSELVQTSGFVMGNIIDGPLQESSGSLTPLSCLQNLVNIGILPGPISFQVDSVSDHSTATEETSQLLNLALGDDPPQYEFKTLLEKNGSKKKKKQELAQVALDSIFGKDNILMNELFSLGDPEAPQVDMTRSLPSDTDEYIRGLQWNLKMYQEGICLDYEYDYGRRMAPTVHDILNYCRNKSRMQEHDKNIGPE
jgi:hypothetical protein